MCRDVARAAEDVDEINVAGYVGDLPIHVLPENLRDVRVVDRHRHNFVARLLRVLGNVEGRLSRLGRLDAEHGDATGLRQDTPNARGVLDQM